MRWDRNPSPHRQQPAHGRGARAQPPDPPEQTARRRPIGGRARRLSDAATYDAAGPALQQLHRLARRKGEEVAEARTAIYQKRLATAEQTVAQAERVRTALEEAGPAVGQAGQRLSERVAHYGPLVRQVIDQARRVLEGQKVPAAEKLLSLFEPHTQIIPRHKGGADVEFGRTVVVNEV